MSCPAAVPTVDVRSIPPRDRHPRIFATFDALALGDAMELVNDHDPRPLHGQFQARWADGFAWQYVEAGPERWVVRITRLAGDRGTSAAADDGVCCGGCRCA